MKLAAKIVDPKNSQGESVNIAARTESDGAKFSIVPPGFYFAVVRELEMSPYQAPWKGQPNPDTEDGTWTYVKLVPNLELVNEVGTIINRQETTLGVLRDGVPYRPDGNKDKAPIWVEAQYLLRSLGLIAETGEKTFEITFNSDHIKDRVIKVKTGIAGYIKGQRTITPEEVTRRLTEQNQGEKYEFDDIPYLLAEYNKEFGTEMKLKNVILNYYDVSAADANKHDWYFEPGSGAVFLTEASWDQYLADLDADEEPF